MRITGFAAIAQGKCLEPLEYEAPKVGDNDVLVEISHCGLCHTDVHFIDYTEKKQMPKFGRLFGLFQEMAMKTSA